MTFKNNFTPYRKHSVDNSTLFPLPLTLQVFMKLTFFFSHILCPLTIRMCDLSIYLIFILRYKSGS